MRYVPVVDVDSNPLMPCTQWRASQLLKRGRAIHFWHSGIFCIKMLDRRGGITQDTVVAIDPGSKREGWTVKSESHTYLNIQSKAVDWVSDKVSERKILRRNRRYRKTPYRPCRSNRLVHSERIPPSTRARWSAKLRILGLLKTIFPISIVAVEDIKAVTKKFQKKWNKSFSPIEVGKQFFYRHIEQLGFDLKLFAGYETAALRKQHGLKKTNKKLANQFSAHCVDSWCMANAIVGGHVKPDSTEILLLNPMRRNYRKLHDSVPASGGIRANRIVILPIAKGALVFYNKVLHLVGGVGCNNNSVSLTDMDGRRTCRTKSLKKIKVLDKFNKFGFQYV